jgi:transcription elongation GreA/GreB family factor
MMEREFVEKRILELSELLKNVEIIDEKSSK